MNSVESDIDKYCLYIDIYNTIISKLFFFKHALMIIFLQFMNWHLIKIYVMWLKIPSNLFFLIVKILSMISCNLNKLMLKMFVFTILC